MGVSSGPSNGLGGLPGDHSWDRKLIFLYMCLEQTKFSLSLCWDEIKSEACTEIKKKMQSLELQALLCGSVYMCLEEQKGQRRKG